MLFEFIPHPSQAYSEPFQKSKMGHFAKMVHNWKLLTFFRKRFILDVWPGSEYASSFCFFFTIYLKLNITIYEKLPKKCIYTIENSLYKRLI